MLKLNVVPSFETKDTNPWSNVQQPPAAPAVDLKSSLQVSRKPKSRDAASPDILIKTT